MYTRLLPGIVLFLLLFAVVLGSVGTGVARASTPAAGPAWHSEQNCRWFDVTPGPSGKTGFTRVAGSGSGIVFTNVLTVDRGIQNRNLLSGSGVAAGDIDGDGWCDLYFCGFDGGNVLYRNLGNWKFEDITAKAGAGLACLGLDSTGAVFADIDGDGDLDLIVNTLGHGPRVFLNDGHGQFTDATHASGVEATTGGMSLALADVDGDGDLDLYVVNYRPTTVMDQPRTRFRVSVIQGRQVVASVNDRPATDADLTNRFIIAPSGEVMELGEPDVLYLNQGNGTFKPVSFTDGSFLDEQGRPLADAPRDWGLSVQFHDFTGDGAPDIYVCNDLWTPDRIWVNDGHGRFRAMDALAVRCTSTFSMGIDFGDLNRDGFVDFMVVDMLATGHKDRHTQVSQARPMRTPPGTFANRPQFWRNTLQINRGDATFAEIAFFAGAEASNWSWMPMFLDVDLDGYEDVLIPNGQMRDFQNIDMANKIEAMRAQKQLNASDIVSMVRMFPEFATPSVSLRNRGNLTFQDTSADWGFGVKGISQGMACADLDNDGDLDLIVNRLNDQAGVFRNDGPAARLGVRLLGPKANMQGIGAKIVVRGGPVEQSQETICGGRYLSGADPLRVFAVGAGNPELTVEVLWRDGRRSLVEHVRGNRVYEIDYASSSSSSEPNQKAATVAADSGPVWFTDASGAIAHQHHEEIFDDFERQPLLPNALSQLGPGIAWGDVDGDGWEDLIVASGKGGTLGVMRNDTKGGFQARNEPPFNRPLARDQTTVLSQGRTLLVGSSNYEDGSTNGGALRLYDAARNATGESILGRASSTGPLALGDIDGDGSLELFVGGRSVPGRYPEPATSALYRNEGGRFVPMKRWDAFGLATSAVFTDLDNDGRPELVVACEWGPVRVFRYEAAGAGNLEEITAKLGLDGFLGWWNSVAAGDFDGDGRMDLVVGNWGLNSRYGRPSRELPRILYYGDLDQRGVVDVIEAYFDASMGMEVPDRGLLPVSAAMPFVRETVESFEFYGSSSLTQIYGDRLKRATKLTANTLASMVFLNRGDRFEARPLTDEAQWAPAFGLSVADFDGDGAEDIFVAQNFFATAIETPRNDAGQGLLLRGDGKGGFVPMPGRQTGLKIHGEQRGSAVADYDHDGRVDIAVAQNGAATRLFHNDHAVPGIRVRLEGPQGNPCGIGASMRVRSKQGLGPARELHAGAGYWSQDSVVTVLSVPHPTASGTNGDGLSIEVRWPGGRTNSAPVANSDQEVVVRAPGL